MAHFAKLDSNNLVTQVIVIGNDDITDSAGGETESIGIGICQKLIGGTTTWKQTSYNATFRGNYAGVGMTYMSNVATLGVASTDVFMPPQPAPSWSIGINTATWYPPDNPGDAPALTDAQRTDNKSYQWNESNYQSDPSTAWVLTSP